MFAGISAEQYRQMVNGVLSLDWKCQLCTTTNTAGNSTTVEDMIPEFDSPTSPIRALNTTYHVRYEVPEASTDSEVEDSEVEHPNRTFQTTSTMVNDVTFDISNREFNRPPQILESSIQDVPLDGDVVEDRPITFEEVENGSKRGGKKLVSSDGYTYTIRVNTFLNVHNIYKYLNSIKLSVLYIIYNY